MALNQKENKRDRECRYEVEEMVGGMVYPGTIQEEPTGQMECYIRKCDDKWPRGGVCPQRQTCKYYKGPSLFQKFCEKIISYS